MITALREQLATDLTALDVTVYSTWPDRISPPCALVVPPTADSYITGGQVFRSYRVSLDVVVLVERGSYDVVLPALESLIADVLHHTEDWGISGVDSPSVVTIGGIDYLGTTVHLSKQTHA